MFVFFVIEPQIKIFFKIYVTINIVITTIKVDEYSCLWIFDM